MEQLFCVDYLFEKDLVHSAYIYVELFGEPMVGSVLTAQFLFYEFSYVNLRPHLFLISSRHIKKARTILFHAPRS